MGYSVFVSICFNLFQKKRIFVKNTAINTYKMKQITLVIIAVCLFVACHRKGIITQTAIPVSTTAPLSILFVQIKVSEKKDTFEAKIIHKKEVAGILDRDINGIQLLENQWLVSFLDSKKNILDQVVVPSPLAPHFEVADDNGVFKSIEIKKTEAEFFFRIQYNPQFSFLQVEEILSNKKKKKLFSINF